jgi:hypothetical protein
MKEVIVFYVPLILGETTTVEAERAKIKDLLHDLKQTDLGNNFHIIIIEDLARSKVETEVFFRKNE